MSILVVGAGIVGLASARALALRGHDVVVAEAADSIGTGISSRNSEVIHAGLYYPTDSLRARHCVEGRRRLYAFCESHGVPHARLGKLVVATAEAEEPAIVAIHERARRNGVAHLRLLTGAEAREIEPNLACTRALLSPETGIVDSHALMLALQGDIETRGGMLAFRTPVERLLRDGDAWIALTGGEAAAEMPFDAVVNAASFGAPALAARTEGYEPARPPRLVLAKGSYFSYAGKPAFRRLVYPAPVEGGLGIHLTLDLAGRMRFGPDVEWTDGLDFTVDPSRADAFYGAIRRYWPALPDGSLVPDYAGIRPKLTGPGEPAEDFRIDGPREHGLPGIVHLFGIESPGLTASLSLAEDVADRLNA
ncbi:NAD(P)/FAD-dependent oxidoreductase [Methylobacterium durans]|uniref:NAD(P)/FAD-dependent oxidoreductase n=1 Tax=Methylobacterium durans TaxID=2202825 RepID=UPI002AFF2D64|nr:NAD(P)/FAD-dependent oxidoreductase [Methylobacterium durans]MEA1833953.1 NAD(P)/FAD-dependent oxidoreductase [Methylobacterium durans]